MSYTRWDGLEDIEQGLQDLENLVREAEESGDRIAARQFACNFNNLLHSMRVIVASMLDDRKHNKEVA